MSFLPSLLESFSGTYVEAMFHGKTILTSDFDFARDVCAQAAFYFDPLDPNSILSSIIRAFGDNEERMRRVREGTRRLTERPEWRDVFDHHLALLDEMMC